MLSSLRSLVDLCFPLNCAACGEVLHAWEQVICLGCSASLPYRTDYKSGTNELVQLMQPRLPLVFAASYLEYQTGGRVQSILHALKYQGKKEIGQFLGQRFGEVLLPHLKKLPDVLVPIPLHPSKYKKRGYNQSEWIAKGISQAIQVPISTELLIRSTYTDTQTKKSRSARWDNVASSFLWQNPQELKGCHLAIVDDVITTGATMEASCLPLAQQVPVTFSALGLAFTA